VIVFEGECHHKFRMVIQQHKGVNFIEYEIDAAQVITAP
jgi:hypothetical protein